MISSSIDQRASKTRYVQYETSSYITTTIGYNLARHRNLHKCRCL
uniref:Uncharacterized protein n=1 Tax=Rhizophora mucronata TaxID=61149 RepID=A0A2P2QYS6_RHIMU